MLAFSNLEMRLYRLLTVYERKKRPKNNIYLCHSYIYRRTDCNQCRLKLVRSVLVEFETLLVEIKITLK